MGFKRIKTNQLNQYHLKSTWRIRGGIEEVCQVLGNTAQWTSWWASAFSEVTELRAGDRFGQGSIFNIISHGFLPYRLNWQVQMRQVDYPRRVYFTVSGDFSGRGIWTLRQVGEEVIMDFDWKVQVEKPLLKFSAWLLKPLFVLNHRWAMHTGRLALQRELDQIFATGIVTGRNNNLYTGSLQFLAA